MTKTFRLLKLTLLLTVLAVVLGAFLPPPPTYSAVPLPTTTVLVPKAGATLSGTTYLDAAAPNATTVEYLLSGGSYSNQVIGTAFPSYYGWLFDWNSTTVPNGTYTLRTEAFNSTGHAFSPSVSFTVNN